MPEKTPRYVSPSLLFTSSGLESVHRAFEELDKSSPHNWLDDNIWLRKAYHEWRAPLIVNSNWWLALADDASIPTIVRYPAHSTPEFTSWQIRRAAWLVHRVLDFRARLDRCVQSPEASLATVANRSFSDKRYTQIPRGQVRCLCTTESPS